MSSSYQVRHVSPLRSLETSVKYDNAKLREKLANRRSILNQSDGKIRRSSEGRYPSVQRDRSAPKPRYSEELIESTNYRSISRKRERKEAAEMKLKGLYSKSSLSMTLSEDSGLEGSKSVFSSVTSNTTQSQILEDMSSDDKSSDGKNFLRNKVVNNISNDEDVKMNTDSSSFDSNKNVGVSRF